MQCRLEKKALNRKQQKKNPVNPTTITSPFLTREQDENETILII